MVGQGDFGLFYNSLNILRCKARMVCKIFNEVCDTKNMYDIFRTIDSWFVT